MTAITITTLTTTIAIFARADSPMPRISNSETATITATAPKLTLTPAIGTIVAIWRPRLSNSSTRWRDQLTETVAAPIAYSSTRSQPMIQATSSPKVA